MKNKLKMINILSTIVIWLLIFIIKWQYDLGNIDITIKTVTIIGVSVNLFCIISMIFVEKKLTSPYILFQMLSIPFLYGRLICTELLKVYLDAADLRYLVTNEALINSCFLIAYCQLGLHIGNLSYKILKKNKQNNIAKDEEDEKTKLSSLKKAGLILLAISIVPAFYQFFMNFSMTSVYGYAGKAMNVKYGIDSIITKIVPFFEISLFMLMVAYRENTKKSKAILIFLIIFYGIQMFFGNRGVPIIAVITSIWLYHMAVKKINKKIIIVLLILVIPISAIMNVIKVNRSTGGFKEWISNVGNLMTENIVENNPITEIFYEIGVAIYPTAYTMDVIPSQQPFKNGETYLLSLLSVVVINTTNNEVGLKYELSVAQQIGDIAETAFGGSYVQEAYANFGWASPIFMILLGVGLEILNRKTLTNNKIQIVLIAYFLNEVLWSIRNSLVALPRELCWYMLTTYIFYKLIYNKQKKINVNREQSVLEKI